MPAKTSLPECTASLEAALSTSHLLSPDLRDAKRAEEKRYATIVALLGVLHLPQATAASPQGRATYPTEAREVIVKISCF